MNTALTYKGVVTLTTKTRTAVAKNNGTRNLFKLLATVLCRETYQTRSLPTYLMLYDKDVESIIDDPYTNAHSANRLLRNYVDIVSQSSNDQTVTSTITSTIDCAMLLKKLTPEQATNVSLCLISGDKKDILAVIQFDPQTYAIVSNGGQTFVKWDLSISNNESEV